MSAVPISRILPIGFLAHLLLFSFLSLSVSVEFTEDTSKLGKINLLQRGHQWAVGHFMGKKSLEDSYRLSERDLEESAIYPQRAVESMRDTLLQEQTRALSANQLQSAQRVLRKILEQYYKMK